MKAGRFRIILGICCTVLILILAATLPALFVSDAPREVTEETLGMQERARLFSLYWAEDESCRVEAFSREDFSEEELQPSGEVIQQLRTGLTVDCGNPLPESAGEHYYVLTLPEGGTLRMREYYEQSAGDWSNWFRIYVDIDTSDVYFLYVSCKCLRNADMYDLDGMADMDVYELAVSWQDYLDADLCIPTYGDGNALKSVYVRDDEAMCYRASYTYYDSPEIVVDFMLRIQEVEKENW